MSDIPYDEVIDALRSMGLTNVQREPSAIYGSPYDYIYMYLTEREHEGKHAIISSAQEYDEEGVFVGIYAGREEAAPSERLDSVDAALEWARERLLPA